MPKLWNKTIESHRREVRDAVLDTTAGLVGRHGLRGVTMSQIADQVGIGRATLYKYFPDVDSILTAWHERQIALHMEQLSHLGHQGGEPGDRLAAVLEAYAFMAHEMEGQAKERLGSHSAELAGLLHRGGHVVKAQDHLLGFIQSLLADAAASGQVRDDVSASELARYCVHALTAAGQLTSKAAVRRLVTVTMAGLAPDDCSG